MSRILIRGGMVIDGTGGPGSKTEIAIDDGVITAVAPAIDQTGRTVLEADGLVVAPGFIDLHSHTDGSLFANPLSDSKLSQGVTTEVTGNCGIGIFPTSPNRRQELAAYLNMHGFSLSPQGISWTDFDEYAAHIDQLGIGPNLAPLIGHGVLRMAVMGSDNRPPAKDEMREMKILLQRSLQQGAWGLSTGLIYPPGSYSQTDELLELAGVAAGYDALFTSHVRGESETLLDSVDEIIQIGQRSGARVQISHLKALGRPHWGKGKLALDAILAARHSGVDIGADQYPYEASSTALSVLVPQWAHSGGVDNLLQRLDLAELRQQLKIEIGREVNVRGGADRIMIAGIGAAPNQPLIGKTVAEIATLWQCVPEDAVIRLLLNADGAVSAIFFSISEADMEYILSCPQVAIGSDGRGINAERDHGESVHPRSYGTFSRILGRFVREKNLLPLETAIYKMTGLPAERLRLADRGQIRPGFAADLTLFDPAVVGDQATFTSPHHYSIGFKYVFVNGQVVVKDDQLTGNAPGRVLRKMQTT
ncbi:MAG TPA: D-aminoacylase [Patescibacteria group bacterium]|nr:D-aminoacylase [Patescibacteria group bacterium]